MTLYLNNTKVLVDWADRVRNITEYKHLPTKSKKNIPEMMYEP